MNIEQLEKGQELQKRIKDLNQTQKELIENYKKFQTLRQNEGISLSFQPHEGHKVVSIDGDEQLKQDVFNVTNNYLMREITKTETEFANL